MRLARALGVTRVARVTSLDRIGIEVACAVRPGGHVLQVCNGKGLTWASAQRGALLETAELAAAEQPDPASLVWGSVRRLRSAGYEVLGADEVGSAAWFAAPALWTKDLVIAFCRGVDLLNGGTVLVPAQAVFCPPPGTVDLGPVCVAWSSNGMGAHPTNEDAALLHALLEAGERDQLARALPEGWTTDHILQRRLADEDLARRMPNVAARVQRVRRAGFEVALFDLSPAPGTPGALGVPIAGALIVDPELGPVPLCAGYACRLDAASALLSALLEAAQSRLTDIHGAREDVTHLGREEAATALALLRSVPGTRRVQDMHGRSKRTPVPSGAAEAVRVMLNAARRAGIRRVVAVTLTRSPSVTIKVVVPGFSTSELLV